ncbi:MAG: hypothetical protein Fur0018_11410 [Anaerolineales bacterium]
MISKTYVKSRKMWRVDFEVPAEELPQVVDVENVHIAGTFNNWDEQATPMQYNRKRRAWTARLYFTPGEDVQFRYVVNGVYWCNDWDADDYVPGGYGEDNCVISLPLETP